MPYNLTPDPLIEWEASERWAHKEKFGASASGIPRISVIRPEKKRISLTACLIWGSSLVWGCCMAWLIWR